MPEPPPSAWPGDPPFMDEILDALDGEDPPDFDAILAAHPQHAATVQRLRAAVGRYRALARAEPSSPSLPDSFEPGHEVGDFVLDSLLAQGGMGVVYLARQRSLGDRLVALKVRESAGCTPAEKARFRREALAVSRLHHPSLAEVYGFGEQGTLLYYAMQYVEGPTLQDLLRKLRGGPSPGADPELCRRLVARVAEVASALAVVHRIGLVHRDVKPANVVLSGQLEDGPVPSGPAVLVDFGLVREAEPAGRAGPGTASATPEYAAPEILLGRPVGPEGDVFGLGVTLHDLLSGRGPDQRLRASAGLEPLRGLVPDLDRDLEAVVSMAVDPVAAWRYADADAFGRDLQAWLEGRPVVARRPGLWEGALRFLRRHPVPVLGTLTSLLLVGLIALGAGNLGRVLQELDEVQEASSRGDLMALGGSLIQLAQTPWAALLMDEELAGLVAGFRDQALHPVRRVFDNLRQERPDRALLEAAAWLRKDGLEAHPRLVRHLLAALQQPGALRSRALQVVGRLFVERPDASPDDAARSEPFRQLLARLPTEPEAGRSDRLAALSALSGCGLPRQVPGMLDWALQQEIGGEEQRLGLHAAGFILVRAASCAEPRPWPERAGLEGRIEAWLRRVGQARPRTVWLQGWCSSVVWPFLESWLVHGRVRGNPSPGAWSEAMLRRAEEVTGLTARPLLHVLAGLADPAPLLEATLCRSDVNALSDAGELCALLGDPVRAAEVRRLGREGGFGPRLAAKEREHIFEEGFGRMAAALEGRPRTDLDRASLLDVLPERSELLLPLDLRSDEPAGAVLSDWNRHMGAVDFRLGAVPGDMPLAAWMFFRNPPEACGQAVRGPPRARGLYFMPTDPHWALGQAGVSELYLPFELTGEQARQDVVLQLVSTAARRARMPFAGVAFVEVELDGTPVHTLAQYSPGNILHEIELPGVLMQPGRHQVRLGLRSDSTTTFWPRVVALQSTR